MGVVRKAGVWLGLIEDDDDRDYAYDDRPYDEDYPDDDDDASAMIRARVQDRLAEQRMQREAAAPVRSLARQQTCRSHIRHGTAWHSRPSRSTRPAGAGAPPAGPATVDRRRRRPPLPDHHPAPDVVQRGPDDR